MRCIKFPLTCVVCALAILLFAAPAVGQLTVNPSPVNFGSVQLGKSASQSVFLSNTGSSSLTISQATISGTGFSLSGLNTPLTLAPNQTVSVTMIFAPQSNGSTNGSMSLVYSVQKVKLRGKGSAFTSLISATALSGTGTSPGQLAANPTSLNFGNIQVGNSQTLPATLTNSGGSVLTISQATLSGANFIVSGLSLPLTLGAGQAAAFSVTFAPQSAGVLSGNVAFSSDGSNPTLNFPLSGTGVPQGTLTTNPTSLSFGNVQVGNSSALSETLTNTGGSSLTISAANASGAGFSISGLTLPLTLTAGQSTSFSVLFTPAASGTVSGSVSITSNGSNPNLSIPLTGTGVTQGTLTPNPSTLGFGNVQVGNSSSLSETLTNTSGSAVTISQANVTGAMFSTSGLTLPLTLTPNQSVTFTATFAPTVAGAATGSLSVVSTAANSPLTIPLSGTGTAAGTLTVSPTSLSFGNVIVGTSSGLNASLTASGASVTVQPTSPTNSEFVLSGISLPIIIQAGQSATFTVTFTPQATGPTSASLSFPSNASNSPTVQSMTGTGTAQTQHTVDLTWNASTGAVGYNIYRGNVSGGPYTMINSWLDATPTYTDNTVVPGNTYYYVVTAVNSNSQESGYSNLATAVIPNP